MVEVLYLNLYISVMFRAVLKSILFRFQRGRAVDQAINLRASQRSGLISSPGSSRVVSVVGIAALAQVLSNYIGFPCHSLIPPITPQSSPSIMQG
jgi:hypothetical protein